MNELDLFRTSVAESQLQAQTRSDELPPGWRVLLKKPQVESRQLACTRAVVAGGQSLSPRWSWWLCSSSHPRSRSGSVIAS